MVLHEEAVEIGLMASGIAELMVGSTVKVLMSCMLLDPPGLRDGYGNGKGLD